MYLIFIIGVIMSDLTQRTIVRVWTSKENSLFPGDNVGHISIETPNSYMSLWPVPFSTTQYFQYQQLSLQIKELKERLKTQEDNHLRLQIEQKKIELNQTYLKYYMQRDAKFQQSYLEDYVAEGNKAPQVTLCFYSLDIYAMEDSFHKLTSNTEGWRLIGSNYFIQKLEKTTETLTLHSKTIESEIGKRNIENCASLALKILKDGGISKLVNIDSYSSFTLKTSSIVKPDDILELSIPAKLAELKSHPQTQNLHFQGETDPDILREKTQPTTSCLII